MTYEEARIHVNELIDYCESHNILGEYEKKLHYASGIYAIKVYGIYVYIGRSTDLLGRMLEHSFMIQHPEKINIYEYTNMKYQMLNCIETAALAWELKSPIDIKPILI